MVDVSVLPIKRLDDPGPVLNEAHVIGDLHTKEKKRKTEATEKRRRMKQKESATERKAKRKGKREERGKERGRGRNRQIQQKI